MLDSKKIIFICFIWSSFFNTAVLVDASDFKGTTVSHQKKQSSRARECCSKLTKGVATVILTAGAFVVALVGFDEASIRYDDYLARANMSACIPSCQSNNEQTVSSCLEQCAYKAVVPRDVWISERYSVKKNRRDLSNHMYQCVNVHRKDDPNQKCIHPQDCIQLIANYSSGETTFNFKLPQALEQDCQLKRASDSEVLSGFGRILLFMVTGLGL